MLYQLVVAARADTKQAASANVIDAASQHSGRTQPQRKEGTPAADNAIHNRQRIPCARYSRAKRT